MGKETTFHILLVEDNPGDSRLMREMLDKAGPGNYVTDHVECLADAIKLIEQLRPYAVVLLDLDLPDSMGFQTIDRMISAAPHIPIVVLTGRDDYALGVEAVEKGAQDYLIKGQTDERLLGRAICYAIERKRLEEALRQTLDNLEFRVWERTEELQKANKLLRKEIAERQRAEEERRLAEEQVAIHRAELAHFSRISTLSEMSSTIAHELNQPLCAILTYAQGCLRMMRSTVRDDGDVLIAMEHVATQAKRAGQIISHLREYGRKREPSHSPMNIADIIRRSIDFLASDIRMKNATIKLEIADNVPPVLADMIEIEQVLVNLIRNGIEAMQDVDAGRRDLAIKAARSGDGMVEVAVCDCGPGLSEGFNEKVFEPFFSTKPEGFGVGLSISRTIIGAHGGRLWAESNAGTGAAFRFTLPVVK